MGSITLSSSSNSMKWRIWCSKKKARPRYAVRYMEQTVLRRPVEILSEYPAVGEDGGDAGGGDGGEEATVADIVLSSMAGTPTDCGKRRTRNEKFFVRSFRKTQRLGSTMRETMTGATNFPICL